MSCASQAAMFDFSLASVEAASWGLAFDLAPWNRLEGGNSNDSFLSFMIRLLCTEYSLTSVADESLVTAE